MSPPASLTPLTPLNPLTPLTTLTPLPTVSEATSLAADQRSASHATVSHVASLTWQQNLLAQGDV